MSRLADAYPMSFAAVQNMPGSATTVRWLLREGVLDNLSYAPAKD